MAIYRNVHLSFWTDNKVEDDFSPEDKYFYLYLLTNPQTNICGCYEVSYKQLENQTGYNKDTINRLIDRFENTYQMIKFNRETKEMLILNWYKYNWSKSENTLKGVENAAKHIKCQEFKDYVLNVANHVRNDTPVSPLVASDTDYIYKDNNINSINNINNKNIDSNTDDADFEKAWIRTFDKYPKKRREVTAKQYWAKRILAVNETDRKQLAIDIYQAMLLYLELYKKDHPEDVKCDYVPKLEEWLEQDCDYWIRQLERVRAEND